MVPLLDPAAVRGAPLYVDRRGSRGDKGTAMTCVLVLGCWDRLWAGQGGGLAGVGSVD